MEKERGALQSVLFQLTECIDAFDVLRQVNVIHKAMLASKLGDATLPISREMVAPLVGIVRDSFCMRLAYLFDKRRDSHSLKKYFTGPAIDTVERHPLTRACVKARHGNIAHMGKSYTSWPDVDDILISGLRDTLESIKIGILINRHH